MRTLMFGGGAGILLGALMRFVLRFGERQGRAAERERHRRDVHDTVLQVMESLAIPAPADELDPAASLDRVRRTARAQALRLRISLEHEPSVSADLHQRLRLLAAEMAAEGLRVEVVVQDDGGLDLPEPSVRALHDAAREALRNTLKHSGAGRAVVCLEECDGGMTLTVRDHGAGFDVRAYRPGFGIENSIIARLDEIGGRVRIESSPGEGTRVALEAPRVSCAGNQAPISAAQVPAGCVAGPPEYNPVRGRTGALPAETWIHGDEHRISGAGH